MLYICSFVHEFWLVHACIHTCTNTPYTCIAQTSIYTYIHAYIHSRTWNRGLCCTGWDAQNQQMLLYVYVAYVLAHTHTHTHKQRERQRRTFVSIHTHTRTHRRTWVLRTSWVYMLAARSRVLPCFGQVTYVWFVCVYVYIYIYIYVCIYIYIYIYTRVHSNICTESMCLAAGCGGLWRSCHTAVQEARSRRSARWSFRYAVCACCMYVCIYIQHSTHFIRILEYASHTHIYTHIHNTLDTWHWQNS
jgi:hypothetical protein